ncbi:MAG: xanthine dehydrogenase family protein subunit M [Candidatus Tectomicrobia bacterium]|nr:xanthine dehydrogenase family protein subunit M [Candidatus Tectomicrobia bacterium]
MIPAPFGYKRPGTLAEALALLREHGEDARLLSGGHSLLPLLKARLARPGVLIDIARIPGLSGITETAGGLRIGALTTHHEVEASPLVREACPLLAEAAGRIGDVQVRNRGTIGGSAAHADPASDYPAALLALEAALVASSPDGTRSIPAAGFFTGPYESALKPGEILTAVEVPSPPRGSGEAYLKAAQQASGFAVCGVAALVVPGPGGTIASARVGVTGVAAPAYRARKTEEALAGKPASPDALRRAAALAAEGVEPLDDFYASADFRRQLARVYAERALAEALRRAKG